MAKRRRMSSSSRLSMAKVRRLVSRAMARVTGHRIRDISIDISTLSTTGVIHSLLLADDDPDYDLKSDGTNIAECQARSKIIKIDLTVHFYFGTDAGRLIEFAIFRDPDNGTLIGTTAGDLAAKLFDPDYTAPLAEVKKNILFYKSMVADGTKNSRTVKIFIKRKALRRAGILNDTDRLKIIFNATNTLTSGTAFVIGKIYTAMP